MPNAKVLQILQVGRQNMHINLYLEFLYSIYFIKKPLQSTIYIKIVYIYVSNDTMDARKI